MKRLLNWIYAHPYYFYLTLVLIGGGPFLFYHDRAEQRDARGRTPLFLAAEHGNYDEVKRLLANGAETDGCDHCRWTPLMKAAQNGFVEIVGLLIAHGADVNAVDKAGYTAVMVAAGDDRAEVIALLARHHADLNAQDTTLGWTGLIWAAKEGRQASVRALLAAGADPAIKDFSGKTALQWAHLNGHESIAGLLQK